MGDLTYKFYGLTKSPDPQPTYTFPQAILDIDPELVAGEVYILISGIAPGEITIPIKFKVMWWTWATDEFTLNFTWSSQLDYVNLPPETPSTPSGPTSGYRNVWYTYSTSTIDPNGDNVRYQFEFTGPSTNVSFMTGWYASGQTGSLTVMWETTDPLGTYYVRVRAQDVYGSWSGWSSSRTVTISSGGGGCPILYVWNGSDYVCEGLLDIHNPEGIDVVTTHTLVTMPKRVNGAYSLRLTEHPQTISHIDQVKLYALLEDGSVVKLPLIWAWHSGDGNVLPRLLFSDEWKVDLVGADHNNGTSQSINLKFATLNPNMTIVGFIFQIEGNNQFYKV